MVTIIHTYMHRCHCYIVYNKMLHFREFADIVRNEFGPQRLRGSLQEYAKATRVDRQALHCTFQCSQLGCQIAELQSSHQWHR